MVSCTFNPSTWEVERQRGREVEVGRSVDLQSEFQDSQGYPEKPYLKQTNKTVCWYGGTYQVLGSLIQEDEDSLPALATN